MTLKEDWKFSMKALKIIMHKPLLKART